MSNAKPENNETAKPTNTETVKSVSINLDDKLATLNKELTTITGESAFMDNAAKGQYSNILKRLTDDTVSRGKLPDIKIEKGGVTVTITELIKANMDVKLTPETEKKVKDIKKQITAIKTLME